MLSQAAIQKSNTISLIELASARKISAKRIRPLDARMRRRNSARPIIAGAWRPDQEHLMSVTTHSTTQPTRWIRAKSEPLLNEDWLSVWIGFLVFALALASLSG